MQNAVTARRQLSLYASEEDDHAIESLRRVLDPVQSQLIPVHVTLAREDELDDLLEDDLRFLLGNLKAKTVTLTFGKAEIFYEHGIILYCQDGEKSFQTLRTDVLGSRQTRIQRPHITLAHPRNPKAPGNSLAAAQRLPNPLKVAFRKIVLIEQHQNNPWVALQEFNLSHSVAGAA